MLKYYLLLILVAGIALFYAFLQDPCNRQIRTEFSDAHPSYEILDSVAEEGSPESVRCLISYQESDREQTYEDVWLYRRSDSGWKFSRILETRRRKETP